jgi:hypothetical protein
MFHSSHNFKKKLTLTNYSLYVVLYINHQKDIIMKISTRNLLLISATLIAISTTVRAQTTNNIYDQIGDQKIADMPLGNFSSWSADDKKNALQNSSKSCLFLCGMAFDAPTASIETTKEENSTCVLSCIAKHLPDEDPREANIQLQAQQHYEKAKHLGSLLPPPTFAHAVPTPSAPSAE